MSELVAAARQYLGVRFRHRGRSKNGIDCAGIVKCSYLDCGVDLPDFLLYGKEPYRDGLTSRTEEALGAPVALSPVRRFQLQIADVMVMRFEHEPHHMAFVTDYPLGGLAMLHADGHSKKVIEHRLADDHIARITHVFRRPV